MKNKIIIIGSIIFAVLGIIGVWIGFEIANDWHAIEKWIKTPYATTCLVVVCVGLVVLGLLLLGYKVWKDGNRKG